MRIALLQFAPVIGNIEANVAKADQLVSFAKEGDFDLLILPEMSFSGYVFESRDDIEPLVDLCYVATVKWAKAVANRIGCIVQAGTPRRTGQTGTSLRNSVVIVKPNDSETHEYDKHFLFDVDERWADEGDGFHSFPLQVGLNTLVVAICMDINPWRFQNPFERFEYATFHVESQADLITGSMAWVLSDNEKKPQDSKLPLVGTLNYWATRMNPIIRAKQKRVIMAVCNRTGGENGTNFCGSSCVLEFLDGGASLLGACGYAEETVLVVEV
ncbi:carbon-nitrogen hydrolase [Obelidium mucronatum]|nr:carbon-nitrogen hydrolase [Obelidium mucronatum]